MLGWVGLPEGKKRTDMLLLPVENCSEIFYQELLSFCLNHEKIILQPII